GPAHSKGFESFGDGNRVSGSRARIRRFDVKDGGARRGFVRFCVHVQPLENTLEVQRRRVDRAQPTLPSTYFAVQVEGLHPDASACLRIWVEVMKSCVR